MSNASLSLIVSMFDTYVSKSNVFVWCLCVFVWCVNVSVNVRCLLCVYLYAWCFNSCARCLFGVYVYFVLDVYYVFVFTFNVDSVFMTMFVFDIFNMYSMCITLECMCLLFATFMSFDSILLLLVSLCLMNMTCNSFILSPTHCLLLVC